MVFIKDVLKAIVLVEVVCLIKLALLKRNSAITHRHGYELRRTLPLLSSLTYIFYFIKLTVLLD
jgi:hypothetical protein